jgi:hypothetical protein
MKCKEQIKTYKEYKIPILSLGLLLSMGLYKMDVVSRYPEKDFDYKNIGFLKNNLNSIYKILCMFKFWLSLINE